MKLIGSLVVLLFVLLAPINAQTAKVIALSSADATEIKDLYAQRDAINQKLEEFKQKVADKYLSDEKPGPGPSISGMFIISTCGLTLSMNAQPCPPETAAEKKVREDREAKEKLQHHLERKPDWFSFEFSEDFKYIVPTKVTFTINDPRAVCGSWGGPAYFGSNNAGPIKNY